MKLKQLVHRVLPVILTVTQLTVITFGQQNTTAVNINDSLSLPAILKQVLATYPTVIKAQEAIQAADAGIGLAKSSYYPNIGGNAGYTYIGPVPELTMPNNSIHSSVRKY